MSLFFFFFPNNFLLVFDYIVEVYNYAKLRFLFFLDLFVFSRLVNPSFLLGQKMLGLRYFLQDNLINISQISKSQHLNYQQ